MSYGDSCGGSGDGAISLECDVQGVVGDPDAIAWRKDVTAKDSTTLCRGEGHLARREIIDLIDMKSER